MRPNSKARREQRRRRRADGSQFCDPQDGAVAPFWQFVSAYEADYVTRDGRLVIDYPEVRRRLIRAIERFTAPYRKGCTPPDSVTWANGDNNEAFLAQTIVLTPNQTLSIPNMMKATRPEHYYDNTVARRSLPPAGPD